MILLYIHGNKIFGTAVWTMINISSHFHNNNCDLYSAYPIQRSTLNKVTAVSNSERTAEVKQKKKSFKIL